MGEEAAAVYSAGHILTRHSSVTAAIPCECEKSVGIDIGEVWSAVVRQTVKTADAVFDVWTSQAAFDRFGVTLMPILQQLALDPGQPHVMDVHNVITPPAARPRPAAKKRAPAKRAAPKKSTARRKGK